MKVAVAMNQWWIVSKKQTSYEELEKSRFIAGCISDM